MPRASLTRTTVAPGTTPPWLSWIVPATVPVVICAAGPYQSMPVTLVELCLASGIHYIDMSDDRMFFNRVRSLVPQKSDGLPAICSGFSTARIKS